MSRWERFAENNYQHHCDFCGVVIEREKEHWDPLSLLVYHKECAKPAYVQWRLTRCR